jgi:hypothetical protein
VTGQQIGVEVDSSGRVTAQRWNDNARSPSGLVGWDGLDAEVLRLFERWLALRDRTWRDDEIRVLGQLLHRCLFPEQVWPWVQASLDGARPVRLSLSFPAEGAYSRLAAVPWEFLHTPERSGRGGFFLAHERGVVLSRYIPLESGIAANLRTESAVRVLVVVSRPDDPRLGEVESASVVEAIRGLDPVRYVVSVCENPTFGDLRDVLDQVHPHLLHFMGHGRFDPDRGQGSLALPQRDGGTDWLDDRRLAVLLRRSLPVPRVVVLHSCEGARTDYAESFAGLAPQLVRSGVQCVVAMQYPVTNDTASDFSTSFYRQVARGIPLDEAVQECRWLISAELDRDPRLVGVPVVYLHSREALLEPELEDGSE